MRGPSGSGPPRLAAGTAAPTDGAPRRTREWLCRPSGARQGIDYLPRRRFVRSARGSWSRGSPRKAWHARRAEGAADDAIEGSPEAPDSTHRCGEAAAPVRSRCARQVIRAASQRGVTAAGSEARAAVERSRGVSRIGRCRPGSLHPHRATSLSHAISQIRRRLAASLRTGMRTRGGLPAAQAWSNAACYRDDHVIRRDCTNAKARDSIPLFAPVARPPAARRPPGSKPSVPATRFAGLGARPPATSAGRQLGARPGARLSPATTGSRARQAEKFEVPWHSADTRLHRSALTPITPTVPFEPQAGNKSVPVAKQGERSRSQAVRAAGVRGRATAGLPAMSPEATSFPSAAGRRAPRPRAGQLQSRG